VDGRDERRDRGQTGMLVHRVVDSGEEKQMLRKDTGLKEGASIEIPPYNPI
jgi:hypothetical protein